MFDFMSRLCALELVVALCVLLGLNVLVALHVYARLGAGNNAKVPDHRS